MNQVAAAPRGRVMIIDDEEAVARAIARTLQKEHDVVTFHDPREALKRFEAGDRFDVVFCDMRMPHLNGEAVYALTKSIDADQAGRFVFITGGTTDARAAAFLSEVANERVEKPFNLQDLRGIARRFVKS